MTAPAAIRQSDLRRAASIVKETGVVIEVERDGVKIRLMPNIPDTHSRPAIEHYEDIKL